MHMEYEMISDIEESDGYCMNIIIDVTLSYNGTGVDYEINHISNKRTGELVDETKLPQDQLLKINKFLTEAAEEKQALVEQEYVEGLHEWNPEDEPDFFDNV